MVGLVSDQSVHLTIQEIGGDHDKVSLFPFTPGRLVWKTKGLVGLFYPM